MLDSAKIGILGGSLLAGVIGANRVAPRNSRQPSLEPFRCVRVRSLGRLAADADTRHRDHRFQAKHVDARLAQILDLLRRMIGSMFMRVNSKCAHQVRPPLVPDSAERRGRWEALGGYSGPGAITEHSGNASNAMALGAFESLSPCHSR